MQENSRGIQQHVREFKRHSVTCKRIQEAFSNMNKIQEAFSNMKRIQEAFSN
ncbi:hypothetical protein ACJMK2_023068, partial [Sinanodonta woodiana]